MTRLLDAAPPPPGTSPGNTPISGNTAASSAHDLETPARPEFRHHDMSTEIAGRLTSSVGKTQYLFSPREMKQAYEALDLKAVAAIGRSPHHVLRVVATADPRLEVKRQQQMTPDDVAVQVEFWMAPLVAERVRDMVMEMAAERGKAARGQWVTWTAGELMSAIRDRAAHLGIEQLMTAEQRQTAAERWAQRRWG